MQKIVKKLNDFGKNFNVFLFLIFAFSFVFKSLSYEEYSFPTWDGTYYINYFQDASWMWVLHPGYPIVIKFFSYFFKDSVITAQFVSIVASCLSIYPFYRIVRFRLDEKLSLLATAVFSFIPILFIFGMVTYSESLYILFLLWGFERYFKSKYFLSGFFFGLAYLTRPEALLIYFAIFLVILIKSFNFEIGVISGIVYWTKNKIALKSFIPFVFGGLILILPYTGYLSIQAGELTLTKKTMNVRPWSSDWRENLKNEGFKSKETVISSIIKESPKRALQYGSIIINSINFVVLIFFIIGLFQGFNILMFSFPILLILPFLGLNPSERLIVPLVPFMIILAFYGISKWRYSLILGSLILLGSVLTKPEYKSDFYPEMKTISQNFEKDKIFLDRKPYVAFFAKGVYEQIPNISIDSVVEILKEKKADYLVLSTQVIPIFRPQLIPLFQSQVASSYGLKKKAIFKASDGGGILIYELSSI